MQFSKHQIAIFDSITNTNKHICVQATAGAGKTTTILESLKLVPRFKKSIFLSFSNGIVTELKEKVPQGVKASTLHSLGCGYIMRTYRNVSIDENKYFKRALTTFYPNSEDRNKEAFKDCYRIQDISNFLRMTLTPLNLKDGQDMCEYYGLDYNLELLQRAIDLIQDDRILKSIDFTDMLYLPVTDKGINIDKYDYVFLDEAQDLNNCQKIFVESLLRVGTGRLIAVGDSYQSIYSFAGSSIDSFEKLQQRDNTLTLTLPVSYRCSRKIVEKAKEVCEIIEPSEFAKEGEVRGGLVSEIKEGDLVICRNTRPLVSLYFRLLEEEVKATIVGKDIEKGLLQLANRCKSYSREIFLNNLNKELQNLAIELRELGVRQITEHPRYLSLLEKIQVLTLIQRKCSKPELIVEKIKQIFHEDKRAAKLMTLHRAKGLENERVFIIMKYNNEKLLPSKHAVQEWELTQERNLAFVGYTRAKNELILVNLVDE